MDSFGSCAMLAALLPLGALPARASQVFTNRSSFPVVMEVNQLDILCGQIQMVVHPEGRPTAPAPGAWGPTAGPRAKGESPDVPAEEEDEDAGFVFFPNPINRHVRATLPPGGSIVFKGSFEGAVARGKSLVSLQILLECPDRPEPMRHVDQGLRVTYAMYPDAEGSFMEAMTYAEVYGDGSWNPASSPRFRIATADSDDPALRLEDAPGGCGCVIL